MFLIETKILEKIHCAKAPSSAQENLLPAARTAPLGAHFYTQKPLWLLQSSCNNKFQNIMSLKSSRSSVYGSVKTSSSLYGSLKSSKSSNSIFGSCLSTTDTIGSFRTAFSGSLSTLYFSAKGADEDSNTLNWTMNYHSFDELSDTSTLVDESEQLDVHLEVPEM